MLPEDLKKYKKRNFTIEDLVLHTAKLVPKLIGKQSRYKVTTSPDVRTIRFYQTRGLLDKPLKYAGTKALYGYRHLLQLLAIKYLQAESLPIRKIKEVIEYKENQRLEELILSLFEYRGTWFEPPDLGKRISPLRAPAKLKSPSERYALEAPGSFSLEYIDSEVRAQESPAKQSRKWTRYEIEEGLELNINEDYRLPKNTSQQMILLSQIKEILRDFEKRRKEK